MRTQKKVLPNSTANPSAYAAVKALKPANDEQQDELSKFYDMCNYFSAKQAIYKITKQVESFISKNTDGKVSVSELNGFKIVQNGTIIHDETSEEKTKMKQNLSLSFSYENRFKPHSESALTFCPGMKLIPLPTFIEAQE